MTRPIANQRLFVAAYPPPEYAAALHERFRHAGLVPCRLVPPEQVHLTLQFIGDTPSREMDTVIESVERAAAGLGPFMLRPRGFIELPERPPFRLVALETDAPPELLELQRRLAHRLARNPRANPADRFRPHLTIARYAPGAEPREASALPPAGDAPFSVGSIRLMRSTLSPAGAAHHEVARVALGA